MDNRHYEKFSDGRVKDIEDVLPFAVPEGWAWCRLGEVCDYGKCENIEVSKLKPDDWILDLEDIEKDSGKIITFHSFAERRSESTKHIFRKGDLLYSKLRPYLNKVVIAPKGGFCTSEILPLNFNGVLLNEFAQRLLMSFFFLSTVNMLVYGVKMPRLGKDDAKKIFIPLPPLAEQKRIVTAIEAIFTQIDLMEQNKVDLQTAVKQAKSKILDRAIHGKLVPQDPADEPASVMLEKFRAEKEAKIAAGEIKRSKNDSYIYRNPTDNCYYQKYTDGYEENISDEIPFAVPAGWAWCRLPNLCKIPITDGTHQTPTYSDKENGIPFLSSKDVTSRKIDWSKIKYITKELHEELQKRIQPCRNDILLAKNGTTGVAALVDTDKIFDIYVTLAVLRPAEVVHPNYLHYVINSPFCKKQFNGHLTGIGIPNLHLNDICKTIIPLPPLSEQQRIVAKIEELFAQLDCITTTLTE